MQRELDRQQQLLELYKNKIIDIKGHVGYVALRLKGDRGISSYSDQILLKLNLLDELFGFYADFTGLPELIHKFSSDCRLVVTAEKKGNMNILGDPNIFESIKNTSSEIQKECNRIIQLDKLFRHN